MEAKYARDEMNSEKLILTCLKASDIEIEILQVNLEEKTNDKKDIQFDFYENKYFYIDDKNQKIYIKEKEE